MEHLLEKINEYSRQSTGYASLSNTVCTFNGDSSTRINLMKNHCIICFSKLRPFQLEQLLNSIELYIWGEIATFHVIFIDDEITKKQYYEVFSRHPNVIPIKETSFQINISEILEHIHRNYIAALLQFLVDDLLFYQHINLRLAKNYYKSITITNHLL